MLYDSSDDIHHADADSMDESTQTALEEGGATSMRKSRTFSDVCNI